MTSVPRLWRMRRTPRALLAAALTAAAAPAPRPLLVVEDWGAFAAPDRCYAIAEPPPGTEAAGRGAFASVGSWPARRVRAQVSVRLSRGHRAGAPVTLSVGDSAFALTADDRSAWAHDRRQDAAIVAAMRSGSSMSVATTAPHGQGYADVYRLRGAATAIDAAMLACPPAG